MRRRGYPSTRRHCTKETPSELPKAVGSLLCQSYPRLTPEALQAVFAFAAEVLKDEDYVALGQAAA